MKTSSTVICPRCVMDDSASEFKLLGDRGCNFCDTARTLYPETVKIGAEGEKAMESQLNRLKAEGKGKKFDAIIGLSGGVDSSYAAWLGAKHGLRLLAVHCDTGWNSETAVQNIHETCEKLDIPLVTKVIDWEEMRSLQGAYFRASVVNCDIPQDHAIVAVNNRIACQYGLKNFLAGGNFSTESILPPSWVSDARDLRNLKDINRQHGQRRLSQYPRLTTFQAYVYMPFIRGVKSYRILNHIEYRWKEAKDVIQRELGWKDYGGKHHESIFTRFYQTYYLVRKFKIEKRRAHLSSLIVSNQITRNEAVEELSRPNITEQQIEEDREFVLKKLRISTKEWAEIMNTAPRPHSHYKNNRKFFILRKRVQNMLTQRGIKLRKSW
jgi:aminotransferase